MARESFDRELNRLQKELITLGEMVEQVIKESIVCLKNQDLAASRRLISNDQHINQKRFAIETDTLVAIATQQPMAGDLRTLAANLEIATELERMGDYAKGIAKIALKIGDQPLLKPLVDIPRMAEIACDMLHQSLEAFVQRDIEKARAIPDKDDEVDALYDRVNRDLLTFIIADAKAIEQANYLSWAAHNLERTADRVTNICERTIFTITGELSEMDSEDSMLEAGF
jgi:phosphate transport system protein